MNYGPPHGALCNLEVTVFKVNLSPFVIHVSVRFIYSRQTPQTILDLLGTYKNIVLVVLCALSNFYATYEN